MVVFFGHSSVCLSQYGAAVWVDALTLFACSSVNPSGEIKGKRQSIYLDRFVISMIAVGLLWAKRPAQSPSLLSNMNRSGIYR